MNKHLPTQRSTAPKGAHLGFDDDMNGDDDGDGGEGESYGYGGHEHGFDDDVVGLTLVKPENLALHTSPSPLAEGAGQQLHQNSRQQWDREASHRGELEQWEHQFEEPDIGPHATPHAR